jgi:sulfide:quinone oxidoreductase
MEFGRGMIAKVDVTFLSGRAPAGALEGPSTELAADKETFGSERLERWFNTSPA